MPHRRIPVTILTSEFSFPSIILFKYLSLWNSMCYIITTVKNRANHNFWQCKTTNLLITTQIMVDLFLSLAAMHWYISMHSRTSSPLRIKNISAFQWEKFDLRYVIICSYMVHFCQKWCIFANWKGSFMPWDRLLPICLHLKPTCR